MESRRRWVAGLGARVNRVQSIGAFPLHESRYRRSRVDALIVRHRQPNQPGRFDLIEVTLLPWRHPADGLSFHAATQLLSAGELSRSQACRFLREL